MSAMGSHDVHNERRRVMVECEVCHAELPSELAARECEEADRIEDLRTRQYFNR